MKKNQIFILILVGFWAVSCNLDNRIQNSKELAEEMRGVQIKRVTSTQTITIVDDWGKRIVKQAQRELLQALRNNPTATTSICALQQLPKIDSLAQFYGVQISLMGAKDIQNPRLSAKEKEILDAYLYNAENKLPQISNIQKLGDSVLIYNAPVVAEPLICKTCFANDPNQLAVWRVRFVKNTVIKKVDAKSLLKMKKK
ncbi:MAG: hypothetical protein EAZ70_10080 [Runella slithyformis]|nr:MAG: hypothetical protein EAY79_10825 [Runella slithyformis]TAE93215.1 MAG: hypothetical protein EAZ80_11745 [Runella slithyformis]TAF25484.1 MAG: hypothetical protein EAZ70_10080 [Runella slithyformis]TAF43804.1 MAG: hypothetical protein EAZ63_13260 [Runella slithyformis]TAF79881.1 MAG: hypothetical protein EAZ50_10180 [Runella slithyformis]